jgi:prefoldin subunit 5
MKLKQNNIKDVDEDLTILFKVVDKLEKRIATLEKVLESHAKCIGRLAHEKENVKTWETTNTSGDKTIWVGRK